MLIMCIIKYNLTFSEKLNMFLFYAYILSIPDIEVKNLGNSTLLSQIFKFTDEDI